MDVHLAVTHSATYILGDAHTNTCENRHSFLRQWLAKFRGVSKYHLQNYLDFFALKRNSPATDSRSSCVTVTGMSVCDINADDFEPGTVNFDVRRLLAPAEGRGVSAIRRCIRL